MTMGENQSSDKAGGKYAERFTPAHVVFTMLLQPHFIGEGNELRSLDKTFLDICCGQGQFSCAIAVLKIFYNCLELPPAERPQAVLRILNSIYGVDIQEKSCKKAKEHLLLTVIDAYKWFFGEEFPCIAEATLIINERITCGNALEYCLDNVAEKDRDAQYYKYVKALAKAGRISQEFAEKILNRKQPTLF